MSALSDLTPQNPGRDPATARPRAERLDGWTPDRQRAFLTALAEGYTVESACRLVGLTHQSAYAFRNRAAGATFALGWQAATLLARNRIADVLVARAIDGQVETITRPDGATVSRHRYDNRLAAAMLTRLDRLADHQASEGTHHAARLVAQEFDAFLDLVERDEGPARAGLFFGLRAASEASDADLAPIVALARADRWCRTGMALAEEVPVADLDPASRAEWTAEQWQRAEAAGLVAFTAPAGNAGRPGCGDDGNPQLPQLHGEDAAVSSALDELDGYSIHWDECFRCYRTDLPPPPDFTGVEDGEFGDDDYERDLTAAETVAHEARERAIREEMLADGRAAAAAYFYGGVVAEEEGADGEAGADGVAGEDGGGGAATRE